MNKSLEKAKKLLAENNYTCVLCKDDAVLSSTKKGVAPLMEWIRANTDLSGFSAADKIVGKAAAMLYVKAKISAVYAPVMSKAATEVFKKYNIYFEYETLTDSIINRLGTGICPMEQAVKNTNSPDEAIQAIRIKMEELAKHS